MNCKIYLVDIENCCYRKLLVFCMSTGYHLQVLDITEDVIRKPGKTSIAINNRNEIYMNMLNYIDPGTGGMVVSSLWNLILIAVGMIAAFFISLFKPVRRVLVRAWEKTKRHQSN